MIRVLADANVLVSAALARSPDAPSVQILDAALTGRIDLVVSPALLTEIESVLTRPRLRRYVSIEEMERFLVELAGAVALERDPPPPPSREGGSELHQPDEAKPPVDGHTAGRRQRRRGSPVARAVRLHQFGLRWWRGPGGRLCPQAVASRARDDRRVAAALLDRQVPARVG